MRYRISHRTSYLYETSVARSFHVLHLKPLQSAEQTLLGSSLLINPAPATHDELIDYFGNSISVLCIDEEHTELTVHARSTVEVNPAGPRDLASSSAWEAVADRARDADGDVAVDVAQFVCPSRQTPIGSEIRTFAERSFAPGAPVLAGAMDLTSRIYTSFTYDPTATDVSTPILKVLQTRRGVCQDFAHLAIAALRALRIPARYVSGHILTRPPPGQPKLRGVDASHAWISVWAPESGWVDFDPTNGLIPRGEHIAIATGRDYDDVCPVSGVLLGGSGQKLVVSVDVDHIEQDAG